MLILPSRIRPARWPLVRGPRHQFALGGLGSCSSPGSSPCCGCPVTFTVKCGTTLSNGSTVKATNPGTGANVSGTTNSSGVVTLDISGVGGAGSYSVNITGGICTSTTLTMTLACGGSYNIACCFSNCGACNLDVVYPTLFITDGAGTTQINGGGGSWLGCNSVSNANTVDSCGCFNGTAPTTQNLGVHYQMQCGPASNQVQLVRTWYQCNCSYCSPPLDLTNCSSSTPPCGIQPCGIVSDTATFTIASCSPFPLSGSYVNGSFLCSGGGTLNSPWGTGVTVNT